MQEIKSFFKKNSFYIYNKYNLRISKLLSNFTDYFIENVLFNYN